ncbi:hypothetical protein D9M73_184560 [compost metagenome]
MPVSVTTKATTASARFSSLLSTLHPDTAGAMLILTLPCSVNLKALDSRFLTTCSRRFSSVRMTGGRVGASSIVKERPRLSATGRKVRSIWSCRSSNSVSFRSSVTVPDSILDR